VKTHGIAACEVTEGNQHDSPMFLALLEGLTETFEPKEILADKEYSSRTNLKLVEAAGAAPYVPFKINTREGSGSKYWQRLFHLFKYKNDEFKAHYNVRQNVEATFFAIKRDSAAPSAQRASATGRTTRHRSARRSSRCSPTTSACSTWRSTSSASERTSGPPPSLPGGGPRARNLVLVEADDEHLGRPGIQLVLGVTPARDGDDERESEKGTCAGRAFIAHGVSG